MRQQAAPAAQIRQQRVVTVRRLGVPICLVASGDTVRGFVNICPHDWIVMKGPRLAGDCLVCPKHNATFEAASGLLVDRNGRKFNGHLVEIETDVRGQTVSVDLELKHYQLLLRAWGQRTFRLVVKVVRGKRGRKSR